MIFLKVVFVLTYGTWVASLMGILETYPWIWEILCILTIVVITGLFMRRIHCLFKK